MAESRTLLLTDVVGSTALGAALGEHGPLTAETRDADDAYACARASARRSESSASKRGAAATSIAPSAPLR